MDFTLDLDNADQVLEFARFPLGLVHDAFDDGISHADSVMANQPDNAHYHSHTVRFRARTLLDKADWRGTGWRVRTSLQNSGIEIVCGPLAIRVLKAQGGMPPHPGRNQARLHFWRQETAPPRPVQLWLAFAVDGITLINGSNLLIDWEIAEKRQLVLALSKPLDEWRYQGKPRLGWRRHVLFDNDDQPRFVPSDEEVFVEPDYGEEPPGQSDYSAQ